MAEERIWALDATPEQVERYEELLRDRTHDAPFYSYLGMHLAWLEEGAVTIDLPAKPELYNSAGSVHGGAIAAVVDSAMGIALATLLDHRVEGPTTIEMKLNYLAPVMGGEIKVHGKVVHKGTRITSCEGEVYEDGRLVVKSLSTYMIVKRKWDRS